MMMITMVMMTTMRMMTKMVIMGEPGSEAGDVYGDNINVVIR